MPDRAPDRRPVAEDVDAFGLTHPGKVRRENQDQFLIASLHKLLKVHQSSLPPDDITPLVTEVLPLDRAQHALARAAASGVLKILLSR